MPQLNTLILRIVRVYGAGCLTLNRPIANVLNTVSRIFRISRGALCVLGLVAEVTLIELVLNRPLLYLWSPLILLSFASPAVQPPYRYS